MIARFHGRGAMPVLLAAAAALVIGVSRVFASAYNTVDLPIGNSTAEYTHLAIRTAGNSLL